MKQKAAMIILVLMISLIALFSYFLTYMNPPLRYFGGDAPFEMFSSGSKKAVLPQPREKYPPAKKPPLTAEDLISKDLSSPHEKK